jgi:hypothetical protein
MSPAFSSIESTAALLPVSSDSMAAGEVAAVACASGEVVAVPCASGELTSGSTPGVGTALVSVLAASAMIVVTNMPREWYQKEQFSRQTGAR